MSVGRTGGGSVGGGGGSVGCAGSITSVGTMAVSVAVIPGTGVGRTKMVAVGVGAGRVAVLVACSCPALVANDADSVRSTSLLDIKAVKATYKPSITTSRTMRNPKAYPLFMQPAMPVMDWNTASQRQVTHPARAACLQCVREIADALYSKSHGTANGHPSPGKVEKKAGGCWRADQPSEATGREPAISCTACRA